MNALNEAINEALCELYWKLADVRNMLGVKPNLDEASTRLDGMLQDMEKLASILTNAATFKANVDPDLVNDSMRLAYEAMTTFVEINDLKKFVALGNARPRAVSGRDAAN